MTDSLKNWRKGMESREAVRSNADYYAENHDTSMDHRQVLEAHLDDVGLPAPNYANRNQVENFRNQYVDIETNRTRGYFGGKLDSILSAIPKEHLGNPEIAARTKPLSGDDARAKAHRKANKWLKVADAYQKSGNKYSAVAEEFEDALNSELDGKFSKDHNPRNEFLNDDDKTMYKSNILGLIASDKDMVKQVLGGFVRGAIAKFTGTFSESGREEAMSRYAGDRIKEQFKSDEGPNSDKAKNKAINQEEAMDAAFRADSLRE